jgi:hypothetical protein
MEAPEHHVCPRCGLEHVESFSSCPHPRQDFDFMHFYDNSPEYLVGEFKRFQTPLKKQILEVLECPADFDRVPPNYLPAALEWYWCEVAAVYLDENLTSEAAMNFILNDLDDLDNPELSGFSGYLQSEILALEEDMSLERELPFIEEKISRAKAVYLNTIRRIVEMRFATTGDYSKHYPNPTWTNREIKTRTGKNKKISIFYANSSVSNLEALMWDLLEKFWKLILEIPGCRMYVKTDSVIGAAKGDDTEYICYDFDFSTPIAHAFPVEQKDVPPGAPFVFSACPEPDAD